RRSAAPVKGRWTVAAVPAQGTRAALLAATRALLQRRVPEGGAGLVAVEGAGEIPGHSDRQTETQRAKPALSGARQEPKTAAGEAVPDAARVIPTEFFRRLL